MNRIDTTQTTLHRSGSYPQVGIVIPVVIAAGLVLVAGWAASDVLTGFLVALAFAIACAGWQAWHTRKRITRLATRVRSFLDAPPSHGRMRSVAALRDLAAHTVPLREQLEREQRLLRAEADRRLTAEQRLSESEERYLLAVTGANDGMWEWNLKSGSAYFSPRWKSMLGFVENEIGERIEEWQSRIHPEDREAVWSALQAHLDGQSERFEYEHRLCHKDGGWRWVMTRAAAVRHASGRAYRLVGLNSDISTRKHAQQVMLELADGMQGVRGLEAYERLVQKLGSLLDVREVFLTQCIDQPPTRVRMLAYWHTGTLRACEGFALAGSPCEEVIHSGRVLIVQSGASQRWPAESEHNTEGYIGLPCIDTRGHIIGHIGCKDDKPLRETLPHEAVLKLFAVRAGVEMERAMLEQKRSLDEVDDKCAGRLLQ